ncbi:MAG: hypothetical protein ICV62_17570 [Cyanobacteria bacterium Co-bin13]|nr:hypothetical protein [Cyanobacteria bacterium Co-bin13]
MPSFEMLLSLKPLSVKRSAVGKRSRALRQIMRSHLSPTSNLRSPKPAEPATASALALQPDNLRLSPPGNVGALRVRHFQEQE